VAAIPKLGRLPPRPPRVFQRVRKSLGISELPTADF
jgi:hypothetical protein